MIGKIEQLTGGKTFAAVPMKGRFPGHEVIVLDRGMKIGVIGKEAA